jgi:hypothetical protein
MPSFVISADHERRRAHAWRLLRSFPIKGPTCRRSGDACTRAEHRKTEAYQGLNDVVSDYLSERHRADRANGCAIAALGPETARQGEDMRRGVTTHVRAQLDRFSQLLRGGTAASRRKRAIAILAGIIGALMLARAVEDPSLSEEILTAARDAFGQGAAVEPER